MGIGTSRQERALREAGCEKVFSVGEIDEYLAQGPKLLDALFRTGDTVVMVQPGQLPMPLMRKIASTGVHWQVPGHDPVTFGSDDDRADWRRQKPRGVSVDHAPEAMGRPPKYPVPTAEQVAALLADWNSPMKRALVDARMRKRMGIDPDDKKALPSHWVRDQVIKVQGNAVRTKE